MRLGALDPAQIERFGEDALRLYPEASNGDCLIALAVSGGPDSLAMLALAAAAFPDRVIAATVDHGLRAESASEAVLVERCCDELDVAHATLAIAVPPGSSGNLHDWARQERYLLLKRWATDNGASVLCTAHHAEDQAETFLMRAARASGLSGLSAVRAMIKDDFGLKETETKRLPDGGLALVVSRREITLLRPLLRWRRQELRDIVLAQGIAFVDDPSNVDMRFERSRFRFWVAQAPWLDPVQVGRSAEHIADAEADLLAVSQWLWTQRALPTDDYDVRFDVSGLPRGVRRYLARIAIDSVCLVNGMPIGGPDKVGNIEKLLDALEAGKGATHARVRASANGDEWHFREAPPRRAS